MLQLISFLVPLHGMQGVRSSSLLGSTEFSKLLTGFFAGGRTNFAKISDGSFRDDGGNIWDLNEHRGARLQMRRADGASMSCYTPW